MNLLRCLVLGATLLISGSACAQDPLSDDQMTWTSPSPGITQGVVNSGTLSGAVVAYAKDSSGSDFYGFTIGSDAISVVRQPSGDVYLSVLTATGQRGVLLPAELVNNPHNEAIFRKHANAVAAIAPVQSMFESQTSQHFSYGIESIKVTGEQVTGGGDDGSEYQNPTSLGTYESFRMMHALYSRPEGFRIYDTGSRAGCLGSLAATIGGAVAATTGCAACAAAVVTAGLTVPGCFVCVGGLATMIVASHVAKDQCASAEVKAK